MGDLSDNFVSDETYNGIKAILNQWKGKNDYYFIPCHFMQLFHCIATLLRYCNSAKVLLQK